jgi:hypothetical protein
MTFRGQKEIGVSRNRIARPFRSLAYAWYLDAMGLVGTIY